ncbi:tripartite tricarboxylate transporter substrate binding protein [Actinophytocola sp. NPDC049390]|uniref:tripartite tricarboxylate transporter substrate binding protein n=1 Tax=Actinophytocola sp. NPDC049390 TaxID=3363894 RepID=UPI003796851F
MSARSVRRGVALVAIIALLATACGRPGQGGGYPARDVQVVVPYPAGSAIDATARALVDVINKQGELGKRLQVVNKEGGAGSVGTTAVLTAKPDGHTIGILPDGPLTLIPHTEEVSYDPGKVTVLSEVTTSPVLFAVPGDSPYQDVADLVAAAKADPGTITMGDGPLNYAIPAQKFEQLTDTRFKHIKFDGDQATTTALLGGNVDVGVMQLAGATAQLKSGKLRVLGIASTDPVDLAPDVPTFGAQDVDLDWAAYNVVVAPAGLPSDVEKKLADVFDAAVHSVEFTDAARELGLVVSGLDGASARNRLTDKSGEAEKLLAPPK